MAVATGSYQPMFSDPTSFRSLSIEPWRQFNAIHLDLSAPLTIITGTNGTGKTTLLSLIGVHFNWHVQLVGTPVIDEGGHLTFKLGSDVPAILKPIVQHENTGPYHGYTQPPSSRIGTMNYENGIETQLLVPDTMGAQFTVNYEQQQYVEGIFLNSHRNISPYQPVNWIPSRFSPAREILESFINEIRMRYLGHNSEKSSMLVMKESLLAAAMYGEGNSSVVPDEEAHAVWLGFQEILKVLLPVELGFEKLKASPPEVLLITRTGDFTVDALSGGLRAVFELAWQIFLRAYSVEQFTVCIDEPENHLHPSLQRTLMPSLMRAFPKVKFLVATHSPFVVRSTSDANVYALSYDEQNKVSAELLDTAAAGLSAEDTLREVLGVGSTLPVWAERQFNSILAEYASAPPNSQTIRKLRDALSTAGLSSEIPEAIEILVNLLEQKQD